MQASNIQFIKSFNPHPNETVSRGAARRDAVDAGLAGREIVPLDRPGLGSLLNLSELDPNTGYQELHTLLLSERCDQLRNIAAWELAGFGGRCALSLCMYCTYGSSSHCVYKGNKIGSTRQNSTNAMDTHDLSSEMTKGEGTLGRVGAKAIEGLRAILQIFQSLSMFYRVPHHELSTRHLSPGAPLRYP